MSKSLTGRNHVEVALTFLELLEDDVERGVDEDEVGLVLVVLDDGLERGVVVGVDEGEVLDEQHGHDVLAVALVDGDTRIPWRERAQLSTSWYSL